MRSQSVKAKLTALTICPCGFSVLKDHIELGTEYSVHPDMIFPGFTYICGRCGKKQVDIWCIGVEEPDGRINYMPLGLFSKEGLMTH